jgi:hypothetical protein
MKIAIMQPTYIPWLGYFELIHSVDTFVFLDDVQFEKSSWQQRNRILINGDYLFLTIPVLSKNNRFANIFEMEIDNRRDWSKKHIVSIEQAYAKCPFKLDILNIIVEILKSSTLKLIDINIPIIKIISEELGYRTKFILSSELKTTGKRSDKLLNILRLLNSNNYLSPAGSKEYIENEGILESAGINVEYQNYIPKAYPQRNKGEFVPFLSIVDLIANVGFGEAGKYI